MKESINTYLVLIILGSLFAAFTGILEIIESFSLFGAVQFIPTALGLIQLIISITLIIIIIKIRNTKQVSKLESSLVLVFGIIIGLVSITPILNILVNVGPSLKLILGYLDNITGIPASIFLLIGGLIGFLFIKHAPLIYESHKNRRNAFSILILFGGILSLITGGIFIATSTGTWGISVSGLMSGFIEIIIFAVLILVAKTVRNTNKISYFVAASVIAFGSIIGAIFFFGPTLVGTATIFFVSSITEPMASIFIIIGGIIGLVSKNN